MIDDILKIIEDITALTLDEKLDIEEKLGEYFESAEFRVSDCDNCGGSGKVRRNYTTDKGYVFHKEKCDTCGGNGLMFNGYKK